MNVGWRELMYFSRGNIHRRDALLVNRFFYNPDFGRYGRQGIRRSWRVFGKQYGDQLPIRRPLWLRYRACEIGQLARIFSGQNVNDVELRAMGGVGVRKKCQLFAIRGPRDTIFGVVPVFG